MTPRFLLFCSMTMLASLATPPSAGGGGGRGQMVPDSFSIIVVGK
jgi:hypothetical protein